jgi:large subunit ribosomal protein L10Ae
MSKVTQAQIIDAIKEVLSKENNKDRKFTQSIELQIGLKDYDPQKDKRFAGTVRLPNIPRPNMKICLIGDAKHLEEAKAAGLDIECCDLDSLKKFNKEKKPIKRWAKKYQILIASDSVVKKIPVVLGPVLNRIGRFPQPVTHAEPLKNKIDDIRASVKFQLKKVLCMACAVGNQSMTEDQLRQNITMAINFLVSLLKKGWNNVKGLVLKTTMGKPIRIYP